jgi:hypothetical protein
MGARSLALLFLLTLGIALVPGVSFAWDPQFSHLEPDARLVPWSTVTRLSLEAGRFPPLYRSQTGTELAEALDLPRSVGDRREQATADWWRARYLHAGGGRSWTGCECKVHPYSLRLQARARVGFSGLGGIVPGEAGLSWAPGWNAVIEPVADWSAGVFWATTTWRLHGRLAEGGATLDPDDPLAWTGWSRATGPGQAREARLSRGLWLIDMPQLLVGAQLGRWSLSAGWAARRTGPGLTGALVLDQGGETFPAFTARRTQPFEWSGVMSRVAPEDLLLRVGVLSQRQVRVKDPRGDYWQESRPWFFQWLMGWEVTSWFRTTMTHTAMAAPREKTLWLDLPQINFPVIGTTWRERDTGPITDRLFAVQMEARWTDAPWPLLPAQAGRAFWEYGGTDFLPSGPGGIIPQISLPASVAGVELVSPVWDVALEYAETRSGDILWYTNSGFPEGYSHEGWLLGHSLGGGAEAMTGQIRWRPIRWAVETGLAFQQVTWEQSYGSQGPAESQVWSLSVGGRPGLDHRLAAQSPLLWKVTAEFHQETAQPAGELETRRDWWRIFLQWEI